MRKGLWNSLCNGSCINLDTDISLLGKTSTQVIFDINGFKRKTIMETCKSVFNNKSRCKEDFDWFGNINVNLYV